ncbi:MAG: hypothetical protein LBU89_02525 [Fibromonadaceae bacterium]|jgi:hypothetical protein|nr:hypothetical protein [Fibromonadaceae bacterium]
MKKITSLMLLLLAPIAFLSCSGGSSSDGINWDGDNGGTLELANDSNKDMIVFLGQTPEASNILGGIRAGKTTTFDISKRVTDFAVGGYTILRGVTKESYDVNPDPAKARVEFHAMVTYKAGMKYRYNINPNFIGDFGFKVTNGLGVGMELRKNSPDGEKVAYLPALQQNLIVYTATTEEFSLFPVYVYFNNTTGEVTTLRATELIASVTVGPRALTDPMMPFLLFPNDASLTWQSIIETLSSPVAYITVRNNVVNQGGHFTIAGSNRLHSQSGYSLINSGERLVFEVASKKEGEPINLIATFYGGTVQIPVRFEGETGSPLIENGYDYTVSIEYIDGSLTSSSSYKATITKGEERDLTDQITSL